MVGALSRLPPDPLAGHSPCIRIQKDGIPAEDQALFRQMGAFDPVSIFKILDIQAENDHGIHVADLVFVWKRQGGKWF